MTTPGPLPIPNVGGTPAPTTAPPTTAPVAPATPVAAPPATPATTSDGDWGALIAARAGTLPPSLVQNHPYVAGQLITSSLPEQTINTIATHYESMADWIAQRDALGGVPGYLSTARAKVLALPDTPGKAAAMNGINSIAALPPAEQQAFMAYVANPTAVAPSSAAAQTVAAALNLQPTEVQAQDGKFNISPLVGAGISTASAGANPAGDVYSGIAGLYAAFPSLRGKLNFIEDGTVSMADFSAEYKTNLTNLAFGIALGPIPGDPYQIHSGAGGEVGGLGTTQSQSAGGHSLSDIAKEVPGALLGAVQINPIGLGGASAAVDVAKGAEEAGQGLSLGSKVFQIGADVTSQNRLVKILGTSPLAAQLGLQGAREVGVGVGSAADKLSSYSPSWLTYHGNPILENVVHGIGSGERLANRGFDGAVGALGYPIALASGAKPGTESFKQRQQMAGSILFAVVAHAGTEFGGALARSGASTAEVAAGDQGIVTGSDTLASGAAKADYGATIAKANEDVSAFNKYAHLQSSYVDPVLKAWAYNLRAAPIESIVGGGAMNSIFDFLDNAIQSNPATARSVTQQHFAGLDPVIIDAAAEAGSRDAMGQAVVDAFYGGSGKARGAEAADAAYADVTKAIAGTREALDRLNASSPSDNPKALPGNTVDTARAADQATGQQFKTDVLDENGNVVAAGKEPLPVDNTNRAVADGLRGELSALMDDLQQQKRVLELNRAEIAKTPLPTFRFPQLHSMPSFLHRVFNYPTTPFEKVFSKMVNPGRIAKNWSNKVLDTNYRASETSGLEALVDKVGSKPTVYNLADAQSPVNAVDANYTLLSRYGKLLGFSEEDMASIQEQFRNVKTDQDHYEASVSLGEMIGKYLPKSTPARTRQDLTRFWDRTSNTYPVKVPDGNGGTRPILRSETGSSIPVLPSEFVHGTPLPNFESVRGAMSASRRIAENAKTKALSSQALRTRSISLADELHISVDEAMTQLVAQQVGPLGRVYASLYNFSNLALDSTTGILKPTFLTARVLPIIAKKAIDEGLGNSSVSGIRGAFRPIEGDVRAITDPVSGWLKPDDVTATIGNTFQDAFIRPGTKIWQDNVASKDLLSGGTYDSNLYASVQKSLEFYHKDPVMRTFASTGFDVEKMVSILKAPGPLHDTWMATGARTLAENGKTWEEALTDLSAAADHAAWGDPALKSLIAHGRIGVDGSGLGAESAAEFSRLQTEQDAIFKSLGEASGPTKRVLQEKYAENQLRLDDIQAMKSDPTVDGGASHVKVGQARTIADYVRKRVEDDGSLTVPENVTVKRYSMEPGEKLSPMEKVHKFSQDWSSGFYDRGLGGPFKLENVGKAEARGPKGNYYLQRYHQYTEGNLAAGMDTDTARAFASVKAEAETRDLYYDLAARSSAERATRNMFWFAPLTGELLHRWLYALPAQNGNFAAGLFLNAAKAENYLSMFKQLGVIQTDKTGALVVTIPGFTGFVSALANHTPLPDVKFPEGEKKQVKLSSLFHLTGDIIPALSPLPAALLNEAANKYGGTFRALGDELAKYSETEILPYAANSLVHYIFPGIKIPDLNPDYIQLQNDRSLDVGLQYASVDFQKQGILPPDPTKFKTQGEYAAAHAAYIDNLMSLAQSYARGTSLASTLAGFFLPGTIEGGSPEQEAYQKFITDNVLPKYQGGPLSDADRAGIKLMTDKWLADHPYSQAFAVSYNAYTGKTYDIPAKDTGDAYIRDLYLNGVKATLAPQDYAEVLAASNSRAMYDAQTNAILQSIAPDSLGKEQAPTFLANWGLRRQALSDANLKWDQYLKWNPDAALLIQKNLNGMAKQYGIQPQSLQLQYLREAALSLDAVSKYNIGLSGLTDKELASASVKVRSEIAQLYTSDGSTPTGKLNQNIAWYLTNVSDYYDKTNPLVKQALAARDAGLSGEAAKLWTQVNGIKAEYANLTHDGVKYPSIDAYSLGGQPARQQQFTLNNWRSKPLAWLDASQRTLAGYPDFPDSQKMWDQINQIDQGVQDFITQNGIVPGSTQYDAIKAQSLNIQAKVASGYGDAGVQAFQLNQASPAQRMVATDPMLAKDATFTKITDYATQISQRLVQAGLTWNSNAAEAVQIKTALYTMVQQAEQTDPQFRDDLTNLSYSIPAAGSPTGQRTHVPLYEAIWFGNFTVDRIPVSLREQFANTGGVGV